MTDGTSGVVLHLAGGRKTFEAEGAPVRARRGANLELARGDFAAIMGPSGCGRSTLLDLIAGLDQPDEGSIVLDDDGEIVTSDPTETAGSAAVPVGA